ncbi:MAG: protein kinase, partial [Gammaproteobacteria bacterium]|nr:protein kinase [Gammaproteobacteria bacterium]
HNGLTAYNYFYNTSAEQPAFDTDSFYKVFVGDIPFDKYRNKIVLIGATATGLGNDLATPVSGAMAPVEVLAHSISSLLQGDFNQRPSWASLVESLIFLLIAFYLMLLLPRLKPRLGILISAGLLLVLIGAEYIFLLDRAIWLRLIVPALFLVLGHVVMTARRFLVSDRLRSHSENESAESNKMLGLTLQNQGQLDMAFEKFRRCPLDEDMQSVLYNLGLDFERKRQFNKANSVYRHIAEENPDYRDLRDRLTQNQNLQQTMILAGGGQPGHIVISDDGTERPMLGRYEIEKEIGRGAMGTVYLGRDPKINRVVAVKVIPLAAEFDDDELAAAKDRFFREAETAGRLNHPDIVTIYDVGEEHDLAYIAMELLTGDHLNKHIKPDKLLPPEWVVDIVARAADALDYAHKQSIVHRDIKPANIMFDPEKNIIKITDFGIARITDSSRTKTGIVLGTPSYMSPEQLAGEKVTGRSDIFSLAVTLYQLLSGQLPFRADSMAALMYKIANEPATPLGTVMPTLPSCLGDIVERALAKKPKDRYRSGAELAIDLRRCKERF